jgi:hypothetical protein
MHSDARLQLGSVGVHGSFFDSEPVGHTSTGGAPPVPPAPPDPPVPKNPVASSLQPSQGEVLTSLPLKAELWHAGETATASGSRRRGRYLRR